MTLKIRKAKFGDVEGMMALINGFAEKGLMLPRSRNTLYESLREFVVIEQDKQLIATGSLHIIWDDLAEIRALAVSEEHQGQGLGRKIVEVLLQEAVELECPKVFTLTYQTAFFERCGFTPISKEEMPHKVWKECIYCVKFPNCDENAMILTLK